MYLPIHMSPSLYIYLNISSSQYHILSDPVFGFVALHNVCDAGVSILSFRYNVHLGWWLEKMPCKIFWTRPTGPDGGSYVISSVSLSVRQSVTKVVILPDISFFWFFASSWPTMNDLKWRSPIFEKKIFGPKMGHLGPKMGLNEILGHFLVEYALVFAGCAYYDWE